MSKMLNAAALSRIKTARPVERVELAVSGHHAFVRALSVRELLVLQRAVKTDADFAVAIVAASLCDRHGNSQSVGADDLQDALGQADFQALAAVALRLNGVGVPAAPGPVEVSSEAAADDKEDGEAENPSPARKRVRSGSSSGSPSRSGGRSKSSTKA